MGQVDSRLFMRTAAEAVEQLARAPDLSALEQAADVQFSRLGCELTVGALIRKRAGLEQEVGILFGDGEHPWVRHYEARGLAAVCPISASAGARPLSWQEIRARPLPRPQRAVFGELSDFALHEGHIVHVAGFGAASVVVSSAGARIEVDDPLVRTLLHLISVNYGAFALGHWSQDHGLPRPEPGPLSARQVDCLRWALEGKSSAEIAQILRLSQRTVDEHFHKACAALGVRTRIQACANAVRLGLIVL